MIIAALVFQPLNGNSITPKEIFTYAVILLSASALDDEENQLLLIIFFVKK